MNIHDNKPNSAASSHVHNKNKNDNFNCNNINNKNIKINLITAESASSYSNSRSSSSTSAAQPPLITRTVEPKLKHNEPVLLPDPNSVISILKKPKV